MGEHHRPRPEHLPNVGKAHSSPLRHVHVMRPETNYTRLVEEKLVNGPLLSRVRQEGDVALELHDSIV